MPKNQRIVLASRPKGAPSKDNFRLETVDIPVLKVSMSGWQQYGISDGSNAYKVDGQKVPLSAYPQFDRCLDYKSQDIAKELKKAAPQGIHGSFENVGGPILDDASFG